MSHLLFVWKFAGATLFYFSLLEMPTGSPEQALRVAEGMPAGTHSQRGVATQSPCRGPRQGRLGSVLSITRGAARTREWSRQLPVLQFCSGSAFIFIQVGGRGLISAGHLYIWGKSTAWVPPSQA